MANNKKCGIRRVFSAMMAAIVAVTTMASASAEAMENSFLPTVLENACAEEEVTEIAHEHDFCLSDEHEVNKASVTLTWPVPGFTKLSRGYSSGHGAIDIIGSGIYGANIVAAYGGTVYKVYSCDHILCYPGCTGNNCKGTDCDGFGTGLIIRGFDGRYYQYAHMIPGSIPSNVYKGAKINQGQVIGQVGNSGAATGVHLHFQINIKDPWHGPIDPEDEYYLDIHSHKYSFAASVEPDCIYDGWARYDCTCGESYTETLPALGHNDVASYVAPTMTEPGNIKYTCSRCSRSYLGEEIPVPEISSDGWYYTDILPSDVSADDFDIEYYNYYEKIQASSPGSDWTMEGVASNEWVDSGNVYNSWYDLATSDSRVLIDSYYYHYCSATTGTVVNYEATSEYVHGDIVDIDAVNVERTGLDGDITYYVLNWKSDGSRVYCNSNTTCDGSYGTHGNRSYAWYKMNWYQDRYQVITYRYTKNTGWVDYSDSGATKISYRFKYKNTAPTGLKATAGSRSVKLTWDAMDGAEKYAVYKYVDGKYTTLTSTLTTNSYTVTGLTNGVKVGFKIKAYAGGKWSDACNIVYATPKASAPTNIKATAGDTKATVTWGAVSGATKYAVYKYIDGKYTCLTTAVTGTSYTVTGLTNGVKTGFKVKAYVDQWSGASAMAYATPVSANIVPQNIKTTVASGKVRVNWDKVSGATKYAVYIYEDGKYTCLNSNITTNTYLVTGLENGTKYGFKVKAYVGKWSGASAMAYATPVGNVVPQNVKAYGTDSEALVTWSAVDGATKYAVYIYIDGKYTCINSNIKTTSYTVSDLVNGTRYGFKVKAYVNGKWSGASAMAYATPIA